MRKSFSKCQVVYVWYKPARKTPPDTYSAADSDRPGRTQNPAQTRLDRTSACTDPTMPGAQQSSQQTDKVYVSGRIRPGKEEIDPPLSSFHTLPLGHRGPWSNGGRRQRKWSTRIKKEKRKRKKEEDENENIIITS